jgi:hypothetical protein
MKVLQFSKDAGKKVMKNIKTPTKFILNIFGW